MDHKKEIKVITDIWGKGEKSLICPQCGGALTIVQVEPIADAENAYIPYASVIECNACPFELKTESYTILGSVKDVNTDYTEIGSWSPSGSRVLSRYKYVVNHDLLKELKNSGELVEFLIVDKQVVQIIG